MQRGRIKSGIIGMRVDKRMKHTDMLEKVQRKGRSRRTSSPVLQVIFIAKKVQRKRKPRQYVRTEAHRCPMLYSSPYRTPISFPEKIEEDATTIGSP